MEAEKRQTINLNLLRIEKFRSKPFSTFGTFRTLY